MLRTPIRVANVSMPNFLSPSTSGRSLVMAITVANTVTKTVMNAIGGLQTNGSPSAALVAWYTPKLSRNPRTVAMMANAATALFFSLSGGTCGGFVGRSGDTRVSEKVAGANSDPRVFECRVIDGRYSCGMTPTRLNKCGQRYSSVG